MARGGASASGVGGRGGGHERLGDQYAPLLPYSSSVMESDASNSEGAREKGRRRQPVRVSQAAGALTAAVEGRFEREAEAVAQARGLLLPPRPEASTGPNTVPPSARAAFGHANVEAAGGLVLVKQLAAEGGSDPAVGVLRLGEALQAAPLPPAHDQALQAAPPWVRARVEATRSGLAALQAAHDSLSDHDHDLAVAQSARHHDSSLSDLDSTHQPGLCSLPLFAACAPSIVTPFYLGLRLLRPVSHH